MLNDVWVSVPVGSEGGGSDVAFKHIRKNQHEDLLFKVCIKRTIMSFRARRIPYFVVLAWCCGTRTRRMRHLWAPQCRSGEYNHETRQPRR